MFYQLALDVTIFVHFAFIVFVIFGGLLAWKWRRMKWVHAPALAYGVLVELFRWYCPLTMLEQSLRVKANLPVHSGSFISRQLSNLIYVDVPQGYLIVGAVAVAALNIALYSCLGRSRAKCIISQIRLRKVADCGRDESRRY